MINEIAEQLINESVDTAFPLELPTMDDLVEIQEEILIHIPPDFKDYLLNCSHVIFGHLEPVTAADPNSHTYLPEVTAEAWDSGMPREYVPICKDHDNYYCIGDDGTVYLWQADSDSTEEVSESIWHWVQDVWMNNSDTSAHSE